MRDVPGSILRQGPRHAKDVIKMVPVVALFGTQHQTGNAGSNNIIQYKHILYTYTNAKESIEAILLQRLLSRLKQEKKCNG